MMPARTPGARRPSRRTTLLLLGVAVLSGLALLWVAPALADPSPAPGPAPTAPGGSSPPGVPDPGTRPPGAPSSPAPSSNPTPAPMPTPGPSSPSSGDDAAWWDIKGQIREAVAELVAWAAQQALQPVMEALGQSWLSTPDFTGKEAAKGIWTTSLVVANAVFVLFIVAGGFVVTARETLQTQHGLKQVLPRLAVGAVAANCSLILFPMLIEWTNALTVAIAGNTVDGPTAATAIRQVVDDALQGNGFLMVLLVIAVIVMCLVLEFTFVLRLAALVILFGIAPVALICHASPYTEGIAHIWWRAVAACLGLQLAQAIVVMATVKVFLTPAGPTVMGIPSTGDGLLGILVCLTMLWVLIKLPGWMRQFVLGPLGQRHGRGVIGSLVHAYLMVKTLGAAAGLTRGASTATRTAGRPGTTPRPPSPPRSGGGPRPPRPRGGPRPSPSPAGPAAFSHAPAAHTPLSSPAGTNAAPAFSDPPSPAASSPSPAGTVPAARFSHPSPPETPRAAPSALPARAVFSDAAPATPRRANSGTPAPGVAFSARPAPQSAPRRPPAPVTPVFSHTPATAAPTGQRRTASPASRPTAARRATPPPRPTTGASTPPAGRTGAAHTPPARTAGTGTARTTPPARQPAPPRRAVPPSPAPSPGRRTPVPPSPRPSPAASRSPAPSPPSPAASRSAAQPPPSPRRAPRSSPGSGPSPAVQPARPQPSPPPVPPAPPSRRRSHDRGDRR